MNILDAIAFIDKHVQNPSVGLPDELFYFISRITPLINIDLLIKDEKGRTLLAWRDDQYAGTGWHVPGGIVRFKERFETRIIKVAETEIGIADIHYDQEPIKLTQFINPKRNIRGHFISVLYRCYLSGNFVAENIGLKPDERGYIKWHEHSPKNLLKIHKVYRSYIDGYNK